MIVERQYEERASKVETKKTKLLLPIKTRDGLIHRTADAGIDGNLINTLILVYR